MPLAGLFTSLSAPGHFLQPRFPNPPVTWRSCPGRRAPKCGLGAELLPPRPDPTPAPRQVGAAQAREQDSGNRVRRRAGANEGGEKD